MTGVASATFNLPKLKRLYLANNKIKCISEGAFNQLPVLDTLTLNNNQIRRFSQQAFPDIAYRSIRRLSISGNPVSLHSFR